MYAFFRIFFFYHNLVNKDLYIYPRVAALASVTVSSNAPQIWQTNRQARHENVTTPSPSNPWWTKNASL